MKYIIKRQIFVWVASILMCVWIPTNAQTYPTKPITVIVPYAPGGNLDVVARLVGQSMGATLGQPIVIDNRPGAGGIVGQQAGARALPDGYTVTTTANGSFAVSPKLQPKPPFKSEDFIPVGSIAVTPLVVEVNANGRFKTIGELLTFAKSHPEEVSIGHSGNGTTNHIAALLMQDAANVKFNIIPYKGSAPAVTDLLAGQIDAVIDQIPSSRPNLTAGKLRPLAITTLNRSMDFPNVPTLAESGFKDFDVSTTTGLLVPAKTPEAIVLSLNKALNASLQQSEVQQKLRELGSEPRQSTPLQFKSFLSKEEVKADMLIKRGLLKED